MKEPIDESEKESNNKLISAESQESFRKTLKRGIYKELHRRALLSDEQLKSLINEK